MDLVKYDYFVGTARGVIIYNTDKQNQFEFQKPEEPSEITALSFRKEDEILVGNENGTFSFFNTIQHKYLNQITDLEGEGRIVGLENVDNIIVAAKHDGIINLWRGFKKNNYFEINLDEKGTLEVMVSHKGRTNVIGTGGEHNDLKLWDIETHQCIFKAKSQGHNMLNLPISTSVKSIAFLPDNENVCVCCTKEGQVLLYDEKTQRRPVIKFEEKKASYTTITATNRDRQCLVGTTRGYMQLLDMRFAKSVKTFTKFTGSVTDIFCDPFEPYVFTTSLDRFFRVYNLDTKEMLHKIYMKQNLTKILVKPVIKQENEENIERESSIKEVEEVDQEYEDIFRTMETIGEKKEKRKRKCKDETTKIKKKALITKTSCES